ncbi:NAD-dependent epimerase/dehydratase family protein [Novosphingobium bradum]|uniref:NAD-dependent epimerase/dehydratase family protein n=1 Tax=Novosphingobium bradum TaxID=1737444 RepID=A0ABV7ITX7_9SPHN
MLKGRKILITGAAGNVGYPLARSLVQNNEVWGLSRFGNPAERRKVEALGVTTLAVDLEAPDFSGVPRDFDYVIHLSAITSAAGLDYQRAIRVNAVGTGLLMTHCKGARAFLSMSTTSVYKPNPDPWHAFRETDPIGDANLPGTPTYSMSKISQEAVARFCALQMQIPTIICRLNAAYGETGNGALPGRLFDTIRDGQQLVLRGDPNPYSPIHDRDIFDQLEAMLGAASVDCPIVNWGGDEAVSAQDMAAFFGELLGVTPDVVSRHFPGSQTGVALDTARRMAITGPCKVHWKDGMREMAEAHMRGRPVARA